MKNRFYILLGMALLLGACMQAVDSDFQGNQGLKDEEILWILQIPASNNLGDKSLSESEIEQLKKFNDLLFKKYIPVIFKGLIEGKLPCYEGYGSSSAALSLSKIHEKLKQLGVSASDHSTLLFKAELFSIVKTNVEVYEHEAAFLRLLSVDSSGQNPVQPFAGAKVNDLEKAIPGIKDFLNQEQFYFFPSYLKSNAREYIAKSEKDTEYLKNMVLNGNWNEIDWLEGQINVSGKRRIKLENQILLSGSYLRLESDSSTNSEELFLTAEKDYLVADWSNRYNVEKLFACDSMEYFSSSGELYQFESSLDSGRQVLFISNGDSLYLSQ